MSSPTKLPETRVIIGVPTYKYVPSLSSASLIGGAVIDCANSGLLAQYETRADMYVTMARNEIAMTALNLYREGKVTHLWFIDDDMVIPQGTIRKLIDRKVDVVGSLYFGRNLQPIIFDIPFRMRHVAPRTGIHQVDGMGCGSTLIHCSVLEKMSLRYGDSYWFNNSVVPSDKGPMYLGEDVHFFMRLHEMGIPCYVDCDASVGHIGVNTIDARQVATNLGILIANVMIARARHYDKLAQAAISKKKATCKGGCADCCYQRQTLDAVDGIVLFEHLRDRGLWNDAFRARLIKEERAIARSDPAARRRCFFLTKENICSVYWARPCCCGYTFGRKPGACGPKSFAAVSNDELHAQTAKTLIEFLELPPLLFNLPGAILAGERFIEGLPVPPVWTHRIADAIRS